MQKIALAVAGLFAVATPAAADPINTGHPDHHAYISPSNPSGFIEGSWDAGIDGPNRYLFDPTRGSRAVPAERYLYGGAFDGTGRDGK